MYELPKLLRELEQIDVFVHDSEHSYEMMMFEFCLSWKHLKQGGYIVCDDHDWNDAFHDFAKAKGLTKYRVGNLGVVKKP
jgi:cephalosporin hydroxylase